MCSASPSPSADSTEEGKMLGKKQVQLAPDLPACPVRAASKPLGLGGALGPSRSLRDIPSPSQYWPPGRGHICPSSNQYRTSLGRFPFRYLRNPMHITTNCIRNTLIVGTDPDSVQTKQGGPTRSKFVPRVLTWLPREGLEDIYKRPLWSTGT